MEDVLCPRAGDRLGTAGGSRRFSSSRGRPRLLRGNAGAAPAGGGVPARRRGGALAGPVPRRARVRTVSLTCSTLSDLGLRPPFRSNRLWAFFDSSYRSPRRPGLSGRSLEARGDLRPARCGVALLRAGPGKDEYLRRLIESCHRRGILVYAWLELPHVSEKFWADHPDWREKTALLQDAHLDWRKLMNLANRDCFAAAVRGRARPAGPLRLGRRQPGGTVLRVLAGPRESIAVHSHERGRAARVPRARAGSIRWNCSTASSPGASPRNAVGLRQFLDFRAGLARGMQDAVAGGNGIGPALETRSGHGADACGRPFRPADAGRLWAPTPLGAALARPPQLHFPGRGSRHRLAPGARSATAKSPPGTRP